LEKTALRGRGRGRVVIHDKQKRAGRGKNAPFQPQFAQLEPPKHPRTSRERPKSDRKKEKKDVLGRCREAEFATYQDPTGKVTVGKEKRAVL